MHFLFISMVAAGGLAAFAVYSGWGFGMAFVFYVIAGSTSLLVALAVDAIWGRGDE